MTETMEILNERLFPVERDMLFQAFADPSLLEKWWGPDGFTNAITAFDFRTDGTWKLTMTASDGNEFHNISTFRDVVVPERIIFEHHEPIHVYRMTMDFIEEPDGTNLRWHMVFEATDELLHLKAFIRAANEQNFNRLGLLLEELASSA